MLSFQPAFSLSFTFIKRLFSSSSFSAIRVVSSAYLRLLIFLSGILIPACASSCLAFRVILLFLLNILECMSIPDLPFNGYKVFHFGVYDNITLSIPH